VLHLVDFLRLHEQNVLGLLQLEGAHFEHVQIRGPLDVVPLEEAGVKYGESGFEF